ncbi:MAG: MFS transporter [Bacteroidota bacterium]|nr:MFS transporter [Bacteroidota bacterium]MDP4227378.1 MFS transporter [Bacteroidota bacterium]
MEKKSQEWRDKIKIIFRTFHSRNYRLFFGGQCISLIGTWMQQIALSWLVYRITGSVFYLGLVGFANQIPSFFISPFAGVMTDKWNRHHILIATQALSMVQALTLWLLVITHSVTIWHILPLSLFLGVINSFDTPARHSFLIDMIENRENLSNAIALNSAMFNSARLIGPSIAGILIAWLGEGPCFLINGLSYIGVIAALLAMRLHGYSKQEEGKNIFQEFKEGFNYTFGFLPIRALLLLLALINLMGMSYVVLMPVVAKDILMGGSHTMGFLMGASGAGALLGAFYLASRKTVVGLSRKIPMALCLFSLSVIAISFSKNLYISLILMFLAGLGMITQMASTNTVIQTLVDDDKRGRVMSFYAMSFMGISPFGSLLAGSLSKLIGVQYTILIGGIACFIGFLIYEKNMPAIRLIIRSVYEKKGILTPKIPAAEDTFEFQG